MSYINMEPSNDFPRLKKRVRTPMTWTYIWHKWGMSEKQNHMKDIKNVETQEQGNINKD